MLRHPLSPVTATQACYAYVAGYIDPEELLHDFLDHMDNSTELLAADPQVFTHIYSVADRTAHIFSHILAKFWKRTV